MPITAITYFDDFEGENKYAFLSNFYVGSAFCLGELGRAEVFPTGEHAFQAYKATNRQDFYRVLRACSPGEAKSYGRIMPLRSDWEAVKLDVMRQVLRSKFRQGSHLGRWLVGTGNAMLIEGTDWGDQVWGVRRKNMMGRNWLGHLLMARRAELASGHPEAEYQYALQYIRMEWQ